MANVTIWGQRECQLQLLVAPEALRARGVTLQEVIRTTGNALEASSPGTGGFIDASIASTRNASIAAGGLVLLVLGGFFLSWRRVLVAAAAVATSIAAAGAVLFLLDGAVNLMVIAGVVLALAVVIDDAIIDTENLSGRLPTQHPPRQLPARRIIIDTAMEMRRPALWASLMIAAAGVPVFFTLGVPGAFLPPLFQAFLLALAASLLVALTVTPRVEHIVAVRGASQGTPIPRRLAAANLRPSVGVGSGGHGHRRGRVESVARRRPRHSACRSSSGRRRQRSRNEIC